MDVDDPSEALPLLEARGFRTANNGPAREAADGAPLHPDIKASDRRFILAVSQNMKDKDHK